MSHAVMLSVRPAWCELIASGKKTIEVRKTRPKLATPFKCYIYCTWEHKKFFWTGLQCSYVDDHRHKQFDRRGNGKVIGEFVCDGIKEYGLVQTYETEGAPYVAYVPRDDLKSACLSIEDSMAYSMYPTEAPLYGWHISALQIYDRPKELREFAKPAELCHRGAEKWDCEGCWDCVLMRPPQSWGYVEELNP